MAGLVLYSTAPAAGGVMRLGDVFRENSRKVITLTRYLP